MDSSFRTKTKSTSCNKSIKKNKKQGKRDEKGASNKKGISNEYCKQNHIRKNNYQYPKNRTGNINVEEDKIPNGNINKNKPENN